MKFFRAFLKLMMFSQMFIIDDMEMGGGADDGEQGDSNTGEGEPSNAPTTTQVSDNVTLSRADLEQLMAPMQEMMQERAVNTAVKDISSRVNGFDLDKVHAHLKEIHKENPTRAESLNNPAGWELLWKAELAQKSVSTDAVNGGRNVDTDGGRSALKERIRNGEAGVHERQALFEKYL